MAITMTIGGASFSPSALSWTYTARNRGTASIEILKGTSGASFTRPVVDDEVLILSGATRIFGGRVLDVTETPVGDNKGTKLVLSAADFNLYATRLTVHELAYAAGAFTRKQILQDLIATYLGPSFSTTLGTVTNGATFDDLRFDNATVEDVLNYITTLTQEVWYIDESNVLQCSAVAGTSTGLALTDANIIRADIQKQRTQYANIVNVIAGPEDMHEVSETFSGAPTSFSLNPLKYISSRGYVIETTGGSDVYFPLGRFGVDSTTWTIDTSAVPAVLHRTSSMGGGAVATFYYTAKFPFAVQAENAAEVAARGPWELTVRAEHIVDYDAAVAYATAVVTQLSVNARTMGEIEIRSPSVLLPRPGQTLTFASTARNLSITTYVIVSIAYAFEPGPTHTMRQVLSVTSGSSLARTWEDFFSGGAGGSSSGGGVLTGTVLTNASGMFDTNVIAHSGETDSISLLQNAVGSTALISNSSCLGPAISIGAPFNDWSWDIIANYLHLSGGIAGGSGRRALCFLYGPGSGSSANSGAMSLTTDSVNTAGVFYLTPENPAATLNIGSDAGGVGVGFRVANVYATNVDAATVTGTTSVTGTSVIAGTLSLAGKVVAYNNIATSGWGVPAIQKDTRALAQTAAVASVATYTLGAADGSFLVGANVRVTTSTTHTFAVQVDYTDETNAARTATLSFELEAGGAPVIAIDNANGAVPYAGLLQLIRCKASTAITVKTQAAGTYTTVTYNVEGIIVQVA